MNQYFSIIGQANIKQYDQKEHNSNFSISGLDLDLLLSARFSNTYSSVYMYNIEMQE